jgi:hypothetical protein
MQNGWREVFTVSAKPKRQYEVACVEECTFRAEIPRGPTKRQPSQTLSTGWFVSAGGAQRHTPWDAAAMMCEVW